MTAGEIAQRLPKGRKSGSSWVACCPAHEDNDPSLNLRDDGGKVLVHCHASCPQDAVIDALKAQDLWPNQERTESRIIATYDYTNEGGELLYQVARFEPKDFRPRFLDGAGGWIWKKHPRQVLYRLPEVLEAPIVFVVEGEKDVERLRSHGFVATTNAGGANARWLPEFTDALRGREVILIPDNDVAGRKRVLCIARALKGVAVRLVVLELEGNGIKDVSDWFNAGHSEVELISMLDPEEASR